MLARCIIGVGTKTASNVPLQHSDIPPNLEVTDEVLERTAGTDINNVWVFKYGWKWLFKSIRSTLNPNHRQSEAQLLPPGSNYKQTSPAAHLILHSHVTIDFIYMRMNILLLFWKLTYSEFHTARGLRGFYGTCNMQLPNPSHLVIWVRKGTKGLKWCNRNVTAFLYSFFLSFCRFWTRKHK